MDISLVLTHDCNLACRYCYMGEKSRRAMPDEVMRRAIELGFSDGAERVQLSFFGGEPLLRWETLVAATRLGRARAEAIGRKLVLTVTTNGTRLDPERLGFLVDEGFFIGLSIDGARDAHDATRPTAGGRPSFDQVLRGLDLCLAAGAWFETITVVDPGNVCRLGESVRWLADRGVTRISLNPNFSAAWSDDDLAAWAEGYREAARLYGERCRAERPIYINVVEDKILTGVKGGYCAEDRCRLGHGAVAVAPSGNLYPCERMVADDRDAALCIGHVDGGIDPARLAALDAGRAAANPDCDGCAVERRCMSFCACANLAETGRLGVAGGVQCWHEQMCLEIADTVGNELWRRRDPHFLARIYGYRAAPSTEEDEPCAE